MINNTREEISEHGAILAYACIKILFLEDMGVLKRTQVVVQQIFCKIYLDEVYLVTALVPSETACLASSPGRSRRTAVWISREVIVERLL